MQQPAGPCRVKRHIATFIKLMLLCSPSLFALCGMLQVSAAPAGATYYVDPAGSNANACTAPGALACKTIAGALGKSANGDSIMLAAGTYNEHLTIDKNITLSGVGAISTSVDGGRTQRVLTVTYGSFVVLANLTVRNGSAATIGGGILNDGQLSLNGVSVFTNTAANGGGIYNNGTLFLAHSSVLSNAAGYGGGIYNFGSPLTLASATLSESVVSANYAITDGGGIYSSHNVSVLGGFSTLAMQNTLVQGNTADRSGAGIYSSGTLLVSAGATQNNRSNDVTGSGGGGGIYLESGRAALTTTSLYGNSTYSGFGGGIYNLSATLTLSNTSITNGGAANGGGLSTGPGGTTSAASSDFSQDSAFHGGALENRGTMTLTNVTIDHSRGDYAGGGIYNSGILTVRGGSIQNSTALGAAYGGGAIYLNAGTAGIDGMSLIGNSANLTYTESGGGIYVASGAVLSLTNSHVDHNLFGYLGQGGGIAAYSTTLMLANVTLNDNTGGGDGGGGGLYLQNVTATLSSLTVSGNTQAFAGGGIDSQLSRVTFADSSVSDNVASADGGGISTYLGTLALSNVSVTNNSADDGGGLSLYDTPASLLTVTLGSNHAGRFGGGIHHYRNTLTLSNVTLSGNLSDDGAGRGEGGAIHNDSGLLIAMNSTLDHNAAAAQGGGLYNARSSASSLTNVTLSANTAITGGGAFNEPGITGPAILTLTNVTLKDNSATDGGGLFNGNHANDYIFLKNTILADSPGGGNCKGKAFTASQYSLSSDGTCALAGLGDLDDKPAQLNPLANNGGPTRTHLPKPASLAVDGVGGSDCPSSDQRGVARPQAASCDIGAVERQASDPALSPSLYLPLVLR